MTVAVRTVREVADLAPLQDAWLALGPQSIDALPDVFAAVLDTRAEVQRPHVLVAEEDGRPVALVVARLEDATAEARFGYATVHRARLRKLSVVHRGVVGDAGDAVCDRLAAELLRAVDAGEADALFFHKVAVDAPLHRAVLRATPARRRQRFLAVDRHWTRELPETFDAFIASVPRRKHLQRIARRLDREYGDRLTFERLNRPEDHETILTDLEGVAQHTYQRGLGAGFHADRDREIIAAGLAAGRYNAWVVRIDGAAVAFEYGEIHGGVYHLGGKGYLPELADKSAGNYATLKVLRQLCEDPAVRRIDFGFGDAPYKRWFGDGGWDETDLTVYGSSARPMAINALHSAIAGADRAARRLAGQDRIARVKARWRAHRIPDTPAARQQSQQAAQHPA